MRYALMLFMLVPALSFASQATCYSSGRMIYSHRINSIVYDDGVFAFEEAKTRKIIFVTGDCVIKV